ncbi:MAG: class I SAM-dependent methyltransferase [Pseudomonadota bacterium]
METTEAQVWTAKVYDANARFVSDLGADVVAWLAPQAGERILDLGCGDGALTAVIAATGAEVMGVDGSADFVAATQARGVRAEVMDGQALTFDGMFDAVFSNAALHWMTDAKAVIAGVHRALTPGGRFVAECGGHGNVASIVTALRALGDRHGIDAALADPWFFPSVDEYEGLLTAGGFVVDEIVLIPRPTRLPTGLAGWLETFRAPFFHAAGDKADDLLAEAEALLAPALREASGVWTADYVRLRFKARRV